VRSYESGIWRIYRILNYIGRDPVSGSEQHRTTVFSKRFLLNSFKRSFKIECCDPSFVEKLDKVTANKLDEFIEENRGLYESFCEYEPEPINAVYNARIKAPDGKTKEEVETCLSSCPSLNELEIGEYLRDAGFDTEGFPYWTVQLVSKNHECHDGYLVYRFHRVLES
jgi:hypothetical protein